MRRDGIQAAALGGRWAVAVSGGRAGPGAARRGAGPDAWRALCVSRLVVWTAGAAAVAVFGLSRRAEAFDPAGVTRPFGPLGDALVAPFGRWDAVWYLAIAEDGYPPDEPRRAAFFPLYPLLVRAADAVVGQPLAAAALVSVACFAAALVLLHRLTALELGPDAARAAVWALALFPAAVFFSAGYSEALFLALSVGSVYAARTGRWAWAGVLGALGAATRSAGVVLVVPLALLWWSTRPRRARDAAWVALVPAGLAAFCGWLALHGVGPLAPFHAQETWFRHFAGPFAGAWHGAGAAWDGLQRLDDAPARADVVLFVFLLLALAALTGAFRRLPAAYGAYALCALALPLSWPVEPQPLMSLPRFLAVLFPLFMSLGAWLSEGSRARERAVLGLSALGLAAASAVFATWHWFA